MKQFKALTQSLWRRWTRWIPIRILHEKHRPQIMAHLQSLGAQDRYLRFGYAATNEQIESYVKNLNFERDDIYGVFNRRLDLLAMAHLAFSVDPQWSTCAEFGVSVDVRLRGRGLGARLFERAVTHARKPRGVFDVHSCLEREHTDAQNCQKSGRPRRARGQ